MTGKYWLAAGAILSGLAVGIGAFGAHGLKDRLVELKTQAIFETGSQYHMVHSLALLVLGLVAMRSSINVNVAGWSFVIGILLFSGSLYALAMTGITKLGMITPLGGVAFLVGWAALAIAALRTT